MGNHWAMIFYYIIIRLILNITFKALYIYITKTTKFGNQNFGYQIWFCTRLIRLKGYFCCLCLSVCPSVCLFVCDCRSISMTNNLRQVRWWVLQLVKYAHTVEPLWKGQESLTKVAKFGPFPSTILYKSCLFYPSWQATSFERPPSWVAFVEGFDCNWPKSAHWHFLNPWSHFLPEANFGLRVFSSPVSVSQCVYQSLACLHDNSSPVQGRITKFGPEKQNNWVKITILGGDWPWPSKSNITSN